MATLFGTTADGESLPVQVNEFGQLVAQGLPGEQGIQGPPGPPGPVGNVAITSGTFSPVFGSDDPEAAGFITYDRQVGTWSRFGDLLTVYVYLRTSAVTLTSIRGKLLVVGVPPEAQIAMTTQLSSSGPFSCSILEVSTRGRALSGRISYDLANQGFSFHGGYSTGWQSLSYADLDSENGGGNSFMFTFSGLAADAVRSVPGLLDDVM